MLCHYIGVHPEKAREKMQPWVDSHMDWVKAVTEYLLKIKKHSLDNYLVEWLHGSFPLDEAGILIIAHAYKIHVAVFFNDSYWTTMAKTDLNKCKVFLLYCGSLVFEDSRRVTVAEYTECCCLYSQLDKYYKKLEKDSEKQKEKERQKQRAIRQSRNHIPSDSESESTESGDRNIMPSTSTTVDASKEKQSSIMPPENNSDTPDGAHAAAADIDLEKMMEDGDIDSSNQVKDNAKQPSSSSSSDSGSSNSEDETSSEETLLEDTEFICTTPTCGEVFQSAAALQAHERKHSLKCQKNGRIPCDYP